VIEVGEEVDNIKVGDKVVTTGGFGSHAQLRAVAARTAWVIPPGMNIQHAAAIPVPFGTADDCLFEFGRMKKGEIVLIQAGASGVGVAAIQLAARAGASMVLATASSDERLEKLKPYGLTHGINYQRDDVVAEVARLTDKHMADVIVDSVGGPTLQTSILSLAYRGRVSMVGQAGREPAKVDVGSMMGGNRQLSGVFLGAEIATDRVHDNIQKLIEDVAKGELKVLIDRTFPLASAADAHRYIESRQAVGRVLLIPSRPAFPVHGEGGPFAEARMAEGAASSFEPNLAPHHPSAGMVPLPRFAGRQVMTLNEGRLPHAPRPQRLRRDRVPDLWRRPAGDHRADQRPGR
jgi:NADPH2:quinone reductase